MLLSDGPAETMGAVTLIYRNALTEIKQWQKDARELRKAKIPMTVLKAWELGDIIHRLNAGLAERGCRIENLYEHLERHTDLSPKRASSFVTLRRYVDDKALIPEHLQWNKILKTVKSVSQAISNGSYREDRDV